MMLRKFRRNSREPTDDFSKEPQLPLATCAKEDDSEERITFFSLPAELRNEIYELVTADATLSLPTNIFAPSLSQKARLALKKRKPLVPPKISGLLLASKQCRQEYLSVLLSSINVVVAIRDFDFDNLIRVSSSLSPFEVQNLQANPNLTLLLDTRNCSAKDMAALRRWLQYRENDTKRLPWKYVFPVAARLPPSPVGKVRLVRELEYYADAIASMGVGLPEAQQSDISALIKAFDGEALDLEDILGWRGQGSRSLSRNVRGLAGGGLL